MATVGFLVARQIHLHGGDRTAAAWSVSLRLIRSGRTRARAAETTVYLFQLNREERRRLLLALRTVRRRYAVHRPQTQRQEAVEDREQAHRQDRGQLDVEVEGAGVGAHPQRRPLSE